MINRDAFLQAYADTLNKQEASLSNSFKSILDDTAGLANHIAKNSTTIPVTLDHDAVGFINATHLEKSPSYQEFCKALKEIGIAVRDTRWQYAHTQHGKIATAVYIDITRNDKLHAEGVKLAAVSSQYSSSNVEKAHGLELH